MFHRFGFTAACQWIRRTKDETYSVRFSQTFTITSSRLYVWMGVKGVYKNFCIYIVRKR